MDLKATHADNTPVNNLLRPRRSARSGPNRNLYDPGAPGAPGRDDLQAPEDGHTCPADGATGARQTNTPGQDGRTGNIGFDNSCYLNQPAQPGQAREQGGQVSGDGKEGSGEREGGGWSSAPPTSPLIDSGVDVDVTPLTNKTKNHSGDIRSLLPPKAGEPIPPNPSSPVSYEMGHVGHKPNSKRVRATDLKEIIYEECTPDEFRLIVRAAVIKAQMGSAPARDWLSGYLIGKPDQNINVNVEHHINYDMPVRDIRAALESGEVIDGEASPVE